MNRVRLAVALLCLLVLTGGGGLPLVSPDLPIDADRFHCVIARQLKVSRGHAAVLGSQDVEDAATATGGEYLVVWPDTTNYPAAYEGVVTEMRGRDMPQWCLSDRGTGLSVIGPLPESVEDAVAEIERVQGGAP